MRARTVRVPGFLSGVGGALFVLSLVVLFGTVSLRWLVSDVGWYRAGFEINGVSERTGITAGELSSSAGQISRYLLLQRDRVDDLSVAVRGQSRPLFNDRETRHLQHVQGLLGGFYALQLAAAAFSLLYLAGSWWWTRRGFWRLLGHRLRWAAVSTAVLFAGFGLLSMLDFDALFLQFHLFSFDGDCWLFDAATDNLVMMFPQPFWYESALRLALATGLQAAGALLAGILLSLNLFSGLSKPSLMNQE